MSLCLNTGEHRRMAGSSRDQARRIAPWFVCLVLHTSFKLPSVHQDPSNLAAERDVKYRRRSIVHTGVAAAAGCLSGWPAWARRFASDATDRFGGWTARRFEATGFFRLEKADRWWLVTPDGSHKWQTP